MQATKAYGESILSVERDVMHRDVEIAWMEKVIKQFENELEK
jgi:hypothetical protein